MPRNAPCTVRSGLAAGILMLSLSAAADAQPDRRLVDCKIESGGKVVFSGKCRFIAEQGGSFALASAGREKPLFGEVLDVSVTLVSPGQAEVRGLTAGGINSRWGTARRSAGDHACWEGSDFRVCAY